MTQPDLTPRPGRKTEALAGGPYNGLLVKKTKLRQVGVIHDNTWLAVYLRRDGRLHYLVSLNKLTLMYTNPWSIPGGIA